MNADEYCRRLVGASGSSLHYSTLFLAAPQRSGIVALHAYWQQLRDAVDGATEPAVAHAQLAWWRDEIDRLYAGAPQHPVTQALAPHRETGGLRRERMRQVVDGMQMVVGPSRFADADTLTRHCRLAAGSIAAMSAGIMSAGTMSTGIRTTAIASPQGPDTIEQAHALGEGIQIVHILRELGEDARRGRIRLPLDDLERYGVTAADILAARYVEGFVPLMRKQAQRARAAFEQATSGQATSERAGRAPPSADPRALQPLRIMAAQHAALLDELEREDYRVLHQRIALTPLRKLAIAWRERKTRSRPQR